MSEDASKIEQIKTLVADARKALGEFLNGLAGIKKEEQAIKEAAAKRNDEKKINLLKSKINQL